MKNNVVIKLSIVCICVCLISSVMINISAHSIALSLLNTVKCISHVSKSRFRFAIILQLFLLFTRDLHDAKEATPLHVLSVFLQVYQAQNLNSHAATRCIVRIYVTVFQQFLNVIVCPDFHVNPVKTITLLRHFIGSTFLSNLFLQLHQ